MDDFKEINRFWYLQRIALPLFFESILQVLVLNINQYMISSYSETGVAAIGNANQVFSLLQSTFSFMGAATVIMISQYRGAGKTRKEHNVYTLALLINGGVSLLLSLFLLLMNRPLFILLDVPSEVMAEAQAYMAIVGGTMFIQALFLTFSAFLRSNALMRFGLIISIVSNIVNVVLNYLLIFGNLGFPELGTVGAAIATAGSRLVGLVLIIIVFVRYVRVSISLKQLSPFPFAQLKRLLQVGMPTIVESLSINITRIITMAFINGFGIAAINTRIYATMLANFSFMYTGALANASQVVLGRFLGAKLTKETNDKCMSIFRIGLIANISIAIVMYLCSDFLFSIFTDSPETLALGKTIMLLDIILEIGRVSNIVFIRSLQTAGDIMVPAGIAVVVSWTCSVGVGYLFGVVLGWGLIGVWIALTLDECIRGAANLIRWKQGKWKKQDLV